jgi:hypothetical protein
MTFSKLSMIAGFIIAFTLIFELAAHANDDNQLTKITFSEAVQVPGQILPAGTYEFILANSISDRSVVHIFNADGTRLLATVATIPTYRTRSDDGLSVTLAQRPDGQPVALVNWFFPGTDAGHEFLYSKQEEKELTQDTKQTLVAHHGAMVDASASVGN